MPSPSLPLLSLLPTIARRVGAAALAVAGLCAVASPAAAYDCSILAGAENKYRTLCLTFDSACINNRPEACSVLETAETLNHENQIVYWMMLHPIIIRACQPRVEGCDHPTAYQMVLQ